MTIRVRSAQRGDCGLEHFQKYCSRSVETLERAVFLVFGFVSAQLQGFSNLLLRRSLAKKPKILAPNGYGIFSNALGFCETTP
jgi:hypothetical protein